MSSSVLGKIFTGKRKQKPQNPSEDGDDSRDLAISGPMNVKHEWHVKYDQSTGQFNGLPPAWTAWLEKSNIRYFRVVTKLKSSNIQNHWL